MSGTSMKVNAQVNPNHDKTPSSRLGERNIGCVQLEETSLESSTKRSDVSRAHINDLPPEVMTTICMNLDSVGRKKIERVCQEWRDILKQVKKFRTHVHIKVPVEANTGNRIYNYWTNAVKHLVKTDVEEILFDGEDMPIKVRHPLDDGSENGLKAILEILSSTVADFSKVQIVFSDWPLYCPIGGDYIPTMKNARKARILRSEIMPEVHMPTLFPRAEACVYFDELFLDICEALPKQVSAIFFGESGPMTERQSDFLQTIRYSQHRFAEWTPLLQKVCYSESWNDILMNIAGGGHVSKFTVGAIAFMEEFTNPYGYYDIDDDTGYYDDNDDDDDGGIHYDDYEFGYP